MTYFIELEQITLKSVCQPQESPNRQNILRKKNKAGVIMLPDFRLYYNGIVQYWHKDRSVKQNWESRNKPIHIRAINV